MRYALLLAALLLPACSSYVAPICDDSSRRDMPNLEGKFSAVISLVSKDGSVTQRLQYTVSRVEKGLYLIETHEGSSRANLCEIAGHYYVEDNHGWVSGLAPDGYVAYQLSPNGDGSFDFEGLGIDSKVLDARAIPYKLVEHAPTPGATSDPGKTPYFSLLADNTHVPPEQFVQLLDPMSLKFTLRPDGGMVQVQGKSSKFSW